jgi:glycosyltransferase involved in cell wall biosynthesis
MKVGIATVQVPFIRGGAEILADALSIELKKRKFEVDIISLPFKWYPPTRILDLMLAARLLDLTEVNGEKIDRLITLKFPTYFTEHPNKVAWILHQHRQAYDLYETPFGDLHQNEEGRKVAAEIRHWDNTLLPMHKKLFTIADNVTQRLATYNQLKAETLYPPPLNYERYYCAEYQPYILVPGRLDPVKRQHLIIEALQQAPNVKLVLIGLVLGDYGQQILKTITKLGLSDRVEVLGVVDEAKKLELYANCLAVYNGVYNEDYGYITLEGFFAHKPVITHTDSGGPLEFVVHRQNGYIVPPESDSIAGCMRELVSNVKKAEEMGKAGLASLQEKNLSWDYVIERLLS